MKKFTFDDFITCAIIGAILGLITALILPNIISDGQDLDISTERMYPDVDVNEVPPSDGV